MINNVQVITAALVELARIAGYIYAIHAAKQFALHWLVSGKGPLLQSKTSAAQDALDLARKAGLEVVEGEVTHG